MRAFNVADVAQTAEFWCCEPEHMPTLQHKIELIGSADVETCPRSKESLFKAGKLGYLTQWSLCGLLTICLHSGPNTTVMYNAVMYNADGGCGSNWQANI